MSALNRKMSDLHESDLASLLGGRMSRGSGNQWHDPIDGRHSRKHVQYSWAWDGKATLGKSIGVSREMWEKARQQAGGDRPLLALRWYDTERLEVAQDLVVLDVHDFVEILEALEGRGDHDDR